jgi:hypothetical protein
MIERVAYLKVCEMCRRHAQIVLPDGNTGRHFASQGDGREEVARLLARSEIKLDEGKFLLGQIRDTDLPEVEPFISEVLDRINELHELQQQAEVEAPHTLH